MSHELQADMRWLCILAPQTIGSSTSTCTMGCTSTRCRLNLVRLLHVATWTKIYMPTIRRFVTLGVLFWGAFGDVCYARVLRKHNSRAARGGPRRPKKRCRPVKMDIYFSRFEIRVFWGDAQISRGETYFSPREIARFRYVEVVHRVMRLAQKIARREIPAKNARFV